jgi:hypothetical protein
MVGDQIGIIEYRYSRASKRGYPFVYQIRSTFPSPPHIINVNLRIVVGVLTTNLKFNALHVEDYNILIFSAEPGNILCLFKGAASLTNEGIKTGHNPGN